MNPSQNEIPEYIAELIDCFQPGVDSLDSPEFAPLSRWLVENDQNQRLFDELCQYDQHIAAVYRDVQVSPGLSDRLKTMLSEPETAQPSGNNARPPVDGTSSERPSLSRQGIQTGSQNSFNWMSLPTAVIAVIVVSLFIGWIAYSSWPSPDGELQDTSLARQAIDWAQLVVNMSDWNEDFQASPFDQNLFDSLQATKQAWLKFDSPLYGKTVAIRIESTAGKRAHVFVVRAAQSAKGRLSIPIQSHSPPLFPRTPSFQTAGYTVGISEQAGMRYLLVVQGNQQDYVQLVAKRNPTA